MLDFTAKVYTSCSAHSVHGSRYPRRQTQGCQTQDAKPRTPNPDAKTRTRKPDAKPSAATGCQTQDVKNRGRNRGRQATTSPYPRTRTAGIRVGKVASAFSRFSIALSAIASLLLAEPRPWFSQCSRCAGLSSRNAAVLERVIDELDVVRVCSGRRRNGPRSREPGGISRSACWQPRTRYPPAGNIDRFSRASHRLSP